MVKFNERRQQMMPLKTAVIKLKGIDRVETKSGNVLVFLHGEGKDETFSGFEDTWKKQGIQLSQLNYGDELLVRWMPSKDGSFKNFKEVFTKKRTTLSSLDKWEPEEEMQDVDMSSWDTGDVL